MQYMVDVMIAKIRKILVLVLQPETLGGPSVYGVDEDRVAIRYGSDENRVAI